MPARLNSWRRQGRPSYQAWGPNGEGTPTPLAVSLIRRIMVEETSSWQKPVISFLGTPPGAPAKGDRYVITTGTGIWASHDDKIAWHNGGGWVVDVPLDGWMVFSKGDSLLHVFDGSAWGTSF